MTRSEIISASIVPKTRSVFFVGCFDSRVTLYAQQVRALNLVDAVLDESLVRPSGKVAIVGGGAAGITAAAAFAIAAPDLQAIDLFEQKDQLLHLQRSSRDRYLHPHLYDWPAKDTREAAAKLPLLDWQAGPASEVAISLQDQFAAIKKLYGIREKTSRTVQAVQAFPHSGCRVLVAGAPKDGGIYDAVFITIGFGYEKLLTEGNYSYWAPSQLAGPIKADGTEHAIFVSGNGDGGLVDFLMAAFNGMTHREVTEFLIGHEGLGNAETMLLKIEERAWSGDDTLNLYEEYERFVLPVLPPHFLLEVQEKLRPDAHVWLHTREPRLFRLDTAILNRFGAFLAIEADKNAGLGRIHVRIGAKLAEPLPLSGPITIDGEPPFAPMHRFLRFGADKESNRAPFQSLVDTFLNAVPPVPRGFRAATPALTHSARARFESLADRIPRPSPPSEAGSVAGSSTKLRVRITRHADGRVVWSGDLAPTDVARSWTDEHIVLEITSGVAASEASTLVCALARVCAHAERCEFVCADRAAWEALFARFVGRALPGPAVDIRFHLRDIAQETTTWTEETIYTLDTVAAEIHAALDLAVLDILHESVAKCLRAEPEIEIGWVIEPQLRKQMWERWLGWHHELAASTTKRRRFLTLLATEQDEMQITDEVLVRLGPRIIRAHLLRAAVFALAFTTCSGRALVPVDVHPGNLGESTVTGHASGVAWIDGREIGPEVTERQWSTSLILLSELKASPELLGAPSTRLDRLATDPAAIVHTTPAEQPIIIGCDFKFQRAMESGSDAVCAYVRGVLGNRAALAAETIES